FSMDLGGSREQYPGRSQVLENYPSLTLTSPTLAVTKWLDWSPNFVYTRQGVRNSDQVGQFAYRYFPNASSGLPDSARINGSTRNVNTALQTPFSIRGFQVSASINETNSEQNYPVVRTFVDPTDTTKRITRTYARSYSNLADWTVGFSLPSFLPSTLKLSPGLTFTNVYGGSYWVQTELSKGQWVHQSKRPVASLSMTPTLFALFPGLGPLTRIRHSITPTISYSYAPKANVPSAYLAALNQSPANFLGSLAQNAVSLRLSQVFEGKLRADTGASGEGQKIKLLALDFTPLTWDFERARMTRRTGLTTQSFGYTLTSDLLPGFNFRSDYSLFQGDIQSDTAKFKPFRESIAASFTLNGQSGVFAALNRLFGRATPRSAPQTLEPGQTPDEALTSRLASLPVAGSYARDRQYQIPDVQTWTSSIAFSSQRQRPPVGGRVVTFDPATVCNQYSPGGSVPNTVLFDQCRQNALLNPQTLIPINDPIAGGVFVKVPPRETIDAQSSFHITEKWSANWGTAYDVVHKQFASQQVTLQRDLHDWRALFSFSQSPNGNFYFSF
ncbi:MAG TPA: putative LPS assembly protein LptD, partial [Candidatus Elarobacter sp.]|nr:putative LPS assembly protein LptD [Candidatus Elarobacter sp.]